MRKFSNRRRVQNPRRGEFHPLPSQGAACQRGGFALIRESRAGGGDRGGVCGRSGDETREQISGRIARETGATIVPPYDHPWTIAGQGTAARELLEEVPDLDALVVCVGGGGLCAGSSIAARHLRPGIRVFGVEPELANDTYLSFAAGERVQIDTPSTIADGLRTTMPGALTFPILRRNVEAIVLVSEGEIREAVKLLMMRMKIVAEPSGAVGAAAVLFKKLPAGIERIGVIISGGNADFEALAAL